MACVPVLLTNADRCDGTITICSGPYATLELAEAACAGSAPPPPPPPPTSQCCEGTFTGGTVNAAYSGGSGSCTFVSQSLVASGAPGGFVSAGSIISGQSILASIACNALTLQYEATLSQSGTVIGYATVFGSPTCGAGTASASFVFSLPGICGGTPFMVTFNLT